MTKEDYLKRINNNKQENKVSYRVSIIRRTLLTVVIVLVVLIICNLSTSTKNIIKKELLERNYNFSKINSLYKKYIANFNPLGKKESGNTQLVSSSKGIEYSSSEDYLDGVKLNVSEEYPIKLLDSGLVVFIGENEGYGMSVIVQQSNGIDVIYGNVISNDIKVYDYIEKGTIIGTANKYLYLVFQKEGEVLDYKKYI